MNRIPSLGLMIILLMSATGGVSRAEEPPTPTPVPAQESQYREVASQIKLFGDVYREVNRRYVDEVKPADFIKAGINGMLETLDPYTVYIEPDNMEQLDEITLGKYGGIGIEIGLRGKDRELTVIAPIEDTPAARKGLRAGDVIVGVDGKSTAGFSTQDATKMIRGPEGTTVTLTIRRAGFDQPLEYPLTRELIRIHDVAYVGLIDRDVGYIKLVHFSSLAGAELDSALTEVMAKEPKGLILDLRSNPGGLLPSAIAVTRQFLQPNDQIVSTRGRTPQSMQSFHASGTPKAPDIPLVLLVNGGSASASEIVAGAIQDLDRGVIIGTQTFGKGLVQSVVNLSEGAVLKITTARYYTPSGRLIQRDRPHRNEVALGPNDEEAPPAPGQIIRKESEAKPDSTAERFTTRSGREVISGSGVTPDITIEQPFVDPVGVEMFRRDVFFSFVGDWLAVNGRPDSVEVPPPMIAAFDHYLDSVKFEPLLAGAGELRSLRQIGEQDSLGAAFTAQLDELQKSLSAAASLASPKTREFIRQSLDREMASALGGREWRIRSTFDEDLQLQKAIEVLRNKENYAALLSTPVKEAISKSSK